MENKTYSAAHHTQTSWQYVSICILSLLTCAVIFFLPCITSCTALFHLFFALLVRIAHGSDAVQEDLVSALSLMELVLCKILCVRQRRPFFHDKHKYLSVFV
jgi:hypothetical protein